MNVYNRSTIIEFYTKHADAKIPLEVWYDEIISGNWKSPNALKKVFGGNLSILKNSRVVFDIKGNDYRLIAVINYENQWLFIKFIGTHSEYDKIDANSVDLYKSKLSSKLKSLKNERRNNKK